MCPGTGQGTRTPDDRPRRHGQGHRRHHQRRRTTRTRRERERRRHGRAKSSAMPASSKPTCASSSSSACSAARWIRTTPSSTSRPARAAPRRRTGRRCCCACICKWAASRGFDAEVIDSQAGEVAGIKSATIEIKGEYAYGWLRTETGVHRLVRKSPFDSGNRRHTSFASVFVSPEVDDDIKIDINPADIKMDVYRSSGAGGQHVNKTESAVRLTHVPTGIVVACQNERSQHKNRATAMKMLKAKLYELEVNKRNAAAKVLEDSKTRRELGQPDPLVRARPVAHQGSAHRRRDRRHQQGARRRPRSISWKHH